MEILQHLETVQRILDRNNLTYKPAANGKPARPGVIVLPEEFGYRLVNVGIDGYPRRYDERQIQLFQKMFPSLKWMLVVNGETRRRAENLKERLSNMASVHAESFDDKVSKMPAIEDIDASKPSEIPRYYGLVDNVAGDNYIVSIFASELPIRDDNAQERLLRPDEGLFQFEVKKTDLDAAKLKSGGLKAALQNVSAENVRVLYFDDNNPFVENRYSNVRPEERRFTHMTKSLDTWATWTEFVCKEFRINPVGKIFVYVEDYYGWPVIEKTAGQGIKITRFGSEVYPHSRGQKAGFYLGAYLEETLADGDRIFTPVKNGLSFRVMKGVTAVERQRLIQEISIVMSRITKALKSLK